MTPVLSTLLHGALGGWDEIAMLVVSVAIGVALAVVLGSPKRKP